MRLSTMMPVGAALRAPLDTMNAWVALETSGERIGALAAWNEQDSKYTNTHRHTHGHVNSRAHALGCKG